MNFQTSGSQLQYQGQWVHKCDTFSKAHRIYPLYREKKVSENLLLLKHAYCILFPPGNEYTPLNP